jgi:hypothetical protein
LDFGIRVLGDRAFLGESRSLTMPGHETMAREQSAYVVGVPGYLKQRPHPAKSGSLDRKTLLLCIINLILFKPKAI